MRRYKITNKLKRLIRDNSNSMRGLSKILGFEIKNICNKNISIREDHLQKLVSLLKIEYHPKEINLNYEKNLGGYAFTQQVKPIKKEAKLSEFIGIMLGDGNIYRDQIKISFDKRDKAYIRYIKRLAENIFGIELRKKIAKGTNQLNLYYYNKNLTEKLLKLGLKRGDKIKNRIGVPKWIKENKSYIKSCIKGLIDTDGCIFICKREKQKYVNFTNKNQRLLKDFKELTKNLGYSFAKSNNANTRLYRKAEVVKFINDIKPFKR